MSDDDSNDDSDDDEGETLTALETVKVCLEILRLVAQLIGM